MEPRSPLQYPFPTRDMLAFGKDSKLQLQISTKGIASHEVFVRVITREGPSEFRFTNSSGGFDQSAQFQIPDIPIFIGVYTNDRTIAQGDVYGVLSLLVNGVVYTMLASGYIYANHAIAWPNVQADNHNPGRGGIRYITVANPEVGEDLTTTVPDGQMWRILGVSFTLATEASAATRTIQLQVTNSSVLLFSFPMSSTQTASLTRKYTCVPMSPPAVNNVSTNVLGIIPTDLYLPPLTVIHTLTLFLQGSDQYSAIKILVEQLYSSEST